jgi:hypothetical protein
MRSILSLVLATVVLSSCLPSVGASVPVEQSYQVISEAVSPKSNAYCMLNVGNVR